MEHASYEQLTLKLGQTCCIKLLKAGGFWGSLAFKVTNSQDMSKDGLHAEKFRHSMIMKACARPDVAASLTSPSDGSCRGSDNFHASFVPLHSYLALMAF